MTIEYLDLADYLAIAAAVTVLDDTTVMKVTNLDLADSPLHASAVGFGDNDFYPDFVTRGRSSSFDWRATVHFRTATNAPLGSRWDFSSTSTNGDGNQSRASTTPKLQLSPSLPANGTRFAPPSGSGPIYARAPHPPNDVAP